MNSIVKSIGQQMGCFFHDDSKVKELKEYAKNLSDARELVQPQVEQYGTRITDDVRNWLEKVDQTRNEIDKIVQQEIHAKMVSWSNGLFPMLGTRHQLSKRAIEMKDEVDKLLEQANKLEYKTSLESENEMVDMVGVRMNGTYGLSEEDTLALMRKIAPKRANDEQEHYQNFESRETTLEGIMKILENPRINVIGISGNGGMGKTTLAREVARRAEEQNLFNAVGMISLPRTSDTEKIQSQIAEAMGLKLEEENVIESAKILTDSLFSQKKSLVILDDFWEEIEFWEAGLMYPRDFNGTILLISRSRSLLQRYTDNVYSVGALEEKEAKTLLRNVARVLEQDSAIESFVSKFAIKTCALSPHLVVSVGSYLRGKSCCQWKIALKMLQDIKFTEFALEDAISINYQQDFGSSEYSLCFLLCIQMDNHFSTMDIVKYYIGFLDEVDFSTLHECISSLKQHISYLKDCNLLMDSHSSDCFTMHDKARDFAQSVKFARRNFLTMRNAKLENWPNKDKVESCDAIFLHSSIIANELPAGIICPRLIVFHLDSDDPSLKVPDDFFEGMWQLTVLKLIGIHLSTLPSSIKHLEQLQTLCMEQCILCDNLSIIGELESLRIRSLSGSEIESLPSNLGQLGELQLLDISNCSKLKLVPPGALSGLESLEYFYSRYNSIQWQIKGQNASLDEFFE